MNKNIFVGMNAWSQLFFFCTFAFVGYILAILLTSIVTLFLFQGLPFTELMQSPAFIRVSQSIAAVCIFLIPSLAFAYLFQNGKEFLKLKIQPSLTLILVVVVLMIAVQPAVNAVGYYNQQMLLPEFMSSVEEWMKAKEKSTEALLNLCFEDKSTGSFIGNFLVMAVLAGIVEEFFFRGCLQQILGRIFPNKHIAVWLTTFVFSAIHLQFYGFIPRLLLGAMLGYLFVWSGSIWLPILAHIVNNAGVVVFTHIYIDTPQYDDFQNIGAGDNSVFGILSAIISLSILFFIYKDTQKKQKKILV